MNHYNIIPITSNEEKIRFVRKMYCLNCKERGGVYIQDSSKIVDEGYYYDKAKCCCKKCSKTFNLLFFNENTKENLSLRKLQKEIQKLNNYTDENW